MWSGSWGICVFISFTQLVTQPLLAGGWQLLSPFRALSFCCRAVSGPAPLLSSFRPRPSAVELFQAPKHCCIDLLSLFSELCPHTHHSSNSATAAVLADSVCPSSAHKQFLAPNRLQNEVGFLSIALQTLAICRTLESAGPLLHPPKDAPPSHAWNNTQQTLVSECATQAHASTPGCAPSLPISVL